MILRHSRSHFLTAALFSVAAFVAVGRGQGVQINDRPLRDLGQTVRERIDQKQLHVTKPFSVQMAAVITDDGKLDRNASKFTSESGDAKMIDVAKQAVMAMGNSGYFGYLQQAGITRATLSVEQSDKTFTGSVRASENRLRAAMLASGINAILKMGVTQPNMQPNEKLVIENTHASTGDGGVNITCILPAADFQRMILGNTTAASGPAN